MTVSLRIKGRSAKNEGFMKQKVSMVIDARILRLAKKRAAEEQRTLSDLIQESLRNNSGETRRRARSER